MKVTKVYPRTQLCLALLLAVLNHAAAQSSNAPSARVDNTAVWTGSDMIVWGGYSGSACLNDGGRYNPAANSWTATTTTSAPYYRENHTAVWTGSKMVIWGGGQPDYNAVYNSGGRYDPALDSWAAVTLVGAPSARENHTAVWTGSRMIVWGGWDSDSTVFGDGKRYDPVANSWTTVTNTGAPDARFDHTAVWTGSEMIIWGGLNGFGALSSGARYNPTTDNWTNFYGAGAVPDSRWLHTAVWTGTEMIIWGGLGGYNGDIDLGDGSRYNPATDSWTALPSTGAPSARDAHTAVWTGSVMIVWGGEGPDESGSSVNFNDGARYNPTTDSWTPVNTNGAPSARRAHNAIWTGSEMIVWGGLSDSGYVNDGGRYNPTTDTWTPLPTNAAPPLSIRLTSTNTVFISWLSPAIGHWLQQNNNLNTTNWTNVGQNPADDGTNKSIVATTGPGENFFRLK